MKRVVEIEYADDASEAVVSEITAHLIQGVLSGLSVHQQAAVLGYVLANVPDKVRGIAVVMAEQINPMGNMRA